MQGGETGAFPVAPPAVLEELEGFFVLGLLGSCLCFAVDLLLSLEVPGTRIVFGLGRVFGLFLGVSAETTVQLIVVLLLCLAVIVSSLLPIDLRSRGVKYIPRTNPEVNNKWLQPGH